MTSLDANKTAPPAQRLAVALLVLLAGLAVLAGAAAERAGAATLGLGVHASALTTGPDGNLWFGGTAVSWGADSVGRISPAGEMVEFALPARSQGQLGVAGVASGPGGLYFTESGIGKIAKVAVDGQITEFALPNPGSRPGAIVLGPDGALWFTEEAANSVGRITEGGSVTEFALPPGAGPTGIAAGPDGALWVAAKAGNSILRLTTGGDVSSYPLPTPGSFPDSITLGPDGSLWFGESAAPQIGRITTAGAIEEFDVPGRAGTGGLAAGPEGVVWYLQDGRIGSISRDGQAAAAVCSVAPYSSISDCEPATALTAGPEGALWYSTGVRTCRECGGGSLQLQYIGAGRVDRFLPPPLRTRIGPREGVVRQGRVRPALICEGGVGGEVCAGHFRLTARLRMPGGATRRLIIARSAYRVQTTHLRRIPVSLERRARVVLAQRGRLSALLTVTVAGGEPTKRKLILRPAECRRRCATFQRP